MWVYWQFIVYIYTSFKQEELDIYDQKLCKNKKSAVVMGISEGTALWVLLYLPSFLGILDILEGHWDPRDPVNQQQHQ